MKQPIGVIAGNRKFPLEFCRAARAQGVATVAIAIKGDTARAISSVADKVYWVGLEEFSRLPQILKAEGVTQVVMAGQISPHRLFSPQVKQDETLARLLERLSNKKADTIFGAIAGYLKENGLELLSSTLFIQELFPKKGTLTKSQPHFDGWEDVYFGFELAKEVAFLDIGQTVAVKEKAVVAVEALEGTDNLIRRAGALARGGITVVKVAKPNQDPRFDVPVVGLNTVRTLIKVRARTLAIEGEKTLFFDLKESVGLADRAGLSIVAI